MFIKSLSLIILLIVPSFHTKDLPKTCPETITPFKDKYECLEEDPFDKSNISYYFFIKNIKTSDKHVLKSIYFKDDDAEDNFKEVQKRINYSGFSLTVFKKHREENQLFQVLEYGDYGNLEEYVKENMSLQKQFLSTRLFKTFQNSVTAIHEDNKVVRKINAKNYVLNMLKKIMMINTEYIASDDQKLVPPEIDFYTPPEILKSDMKKPFPYTAAQDMWSLGILLYFFILKKYPFEVKKLSKKALYNRIIQGNIYFPERVRFSLIEIILKLLKINPRERMNMDDLDDAMNRIAKEAEHPALKDNILYNINLKIPKTIKMMKDMGELASGEEIEEESLNTKLIGAVVGGIVLITVAIVVIFMRARRKNAVTVPETTTPL